MQSLLPTIRADLELSETYAPCHEESLACPVTAFGGLADGSVDREGLRAWSSVTRAAFRMRLLDGGHFYLADKGDEIGDEIVEALRVAR